MSLVSLSLSLFNSSISLFVVVCSISLSLSQCRVRGDIRKAFGHFICVLFTWGWLLCGDHDDTCFTGRLFGEQGAPAGNISVRLGLVVATRVFVSVCASRPASWMCIVCVLFENPVYESVLCVGVCLFRVGIRYVVVGWCLGCRLLCLACDSLRALLIPSRVGR